MQERNGTEKYPAPDWWHKAIKEGFEAENDSIEFFVSRVYRAPSGLEFRVISVSEGYDFNGLPHGVYAETNVAIEMLQRDIGIISPLNTKLTMVMAEASRTRPVVIADLPQNLRERFPDGAVIDLGNTIQLTYWGKTGNGGSVFELTPAPLEKVVNAINRI